MMATASDLEAIAQLTATVARHTTELETMNKNLVVPLQAKRASHGIHGGCNKDACRWEYGTTPKTVAEAPTLEEAEGGTGLDIPIHNCSMCGPRCRHNSDNCPVSAVSHIYTETKMNMQSRAEATQ